MNNELDDMSLALTHLTVGLEKMRLAEKVDLLARLRPVIKHAQEADELIKTEIKAKLKGKSGKVHGKFFTAIYSVNKVTRLNQSKLSEAHPDIVEEFLEVRPEGRVTFEPR